MKRNLVLIAAALLACAGTIGSLAQGRRHGSTPTPAPTSTSTTPLNDAARAALISALAGPDGEYAARAEYEAILDKFGPATLPYAHLLQAEGKHVAALEQQCRNFGVPIPADEFLGKVQPPASLAEAAKAGLLAEDANVRMYAQLLKAVEGYPSLVRVFTQLQAASLDRHLPALKLAEANGGTVQPGLCGQAGGGRSQGGPGCQAGRGCGSGGGCRSGAQATPRGGRQQQQQRQGTCLAP